jgi:hypothetical protein
MLADMMRGGFDALATAMDQIIRTGTEAAAATVNLKEQELEEEEEEMEDGKAGNKRRKKPSLPPKPRARSLEAAYPALAPSGH